MLGGTVDPELVVLDMAGTTVRDDGLVERAFVAAVAAVGVPAERDVLAHVRSTMGQSKIDVFRSLPLDEDRAQHANRAFERAYDDLVGQGLAVSVPGAAAAVGELREAGMTVAFTTGFSPATRDGLLAALGWSDLADLVLSPADAGRDRPFPDMVLTAVLRSGTSDVRRVAVAGDTASDMVAGRRAGAGIVVGVLTGAHNEGALRAAGATDVLASVADLPALLLGHPNE